VKARAPGKLVISGAYAVLEGAPAIVSAVDRFVTADAARPAERVTPEVRAALANANAPWFDASELRQGGQKLGLGSSAAILVASLAARVLAERGPLADRELAAAVAAPALAAHAAAQAGGSGVDVAAAAYGGTLLFRRAAPTHAESVPLPAAVHVETFWSGAEASTSALVSRVFSLQERDAAAFSRLLGAQAAAAEAAERALRAGDGAGLVAALAAQRHALTELGSAAGVAIVTPSARVLAGAAEREQATALPAGAGGGDVLIFAGRSESSDGFRELAEQHGYLRLELRLGARGVHAVDSA
jgi:phosphomevalonate kinase